MAVRAHRFQQLYTVNETVNLAEELAARVKDPLWFLARQWQTGEFEAENGGRPATMSFSTEASRFTGAVLRGDGGTPQAVALDPDIPLEAVIEAEEQGVSKAWSKQALEYVFDVVSDKHLLKAEEYHGNGLDWFHFEMDTQPNHPDAEIQVDRQTVFPTQLSFAGTPDPRWWRFEEGDTYFDAPEDAEPNMLSQLLPEFFYADVNNWYIAPVELPSGAICRVTSVSLTDSFGFNTFLKPVSEPEWKMFELSTRDNKVEPAGQIMTPNIALEILHNDILEDIRFIRDEDANLVWAVERLVTDGQGNQISNGDGRVNERGDYGNGAEPVSDLAQFRLSTEAPPHWIPYVPRVADQAGAPQGDMYLRRARTQESATTDDPQHRSHVVGESRFLNENEVPRSGIRVRRIQRYARGNDGEGYFWTGRTRTSGRESGGSGLRFDILDV